MISFLTTSNIVVTLKQKKKNCRHRNVGKIESHNRMIYLRSQPKKSAILWHTTESTNLSSSTSRHVFLPSCDHLQRKKTRVDSYFTKLNLFLIILLWKLLQNNWRCGIEDVWFTCFKQKNIKLWNYSKILLDCVIHLNISIATFTDISRSMVFFVMNPDF